jgi:hypothetical protein
MLGVTMLSVALDVVAEGPVDGFEVGYVGEDGTLHRLPLADWAVRFEVMAPVRRFTSRKGQRHLPVRRPELTGSAPNRSRACGNGRGQ